MNIFDEENCLLCFYSSFFIIFFFPSFLPPTLRFNPAILINWVRGRIWSVGWEAVLRGFQVQFSIDEKYPRWKFWKMESLRLNIGNYSRKFSIKMVVWWWYLKHLIRINDDEDYNESQLTQTQLREEIISRTCER